MSSRQDLPVEIGAAPGGAVRPPRYSSLAALIFEEASAEQDLQPILLGCLGSPDYCSVEISLRQLRHLILDVIRALQERGIRPGQTVALVRLPRTSEVLTAVIYAALSAWGVRAFFPMYLELDAMEGWLRASGATALLMSPFEVERSGAQEADVAVTRRLRAMAARLELPVHCFYQDLNLPLILEQQRARARSPGVEDPLVRELLRSTSHDTECLLLTTSGTSGRGKLVRYSQGALLRSCAAWEAAGLFDPARQGGRCLSLLLAHSMGVRALWNAVWTRQPLCLITPEWFIDAPERVSELLLRMQPEHVTGGPATFHTLLELARAFPRLKERCFRELKCLVSSGAPYDPALRRRIRSAFGLELHNAFGMTETMQVSSTLVGPGAEEVGAGRLGRPLPGVRLRLSRDAALPTGRYRLSVCSPFGFSGYLEPGAPQRPAAAATWLQTGDLVEQEPGGALRCVGREGDDFINDGLGVKISRRRLEALYSCDPGELMQWIELFPLQEEPGLAALVFLTAVEGAEGEPVTDRALLRRVQSFFESRLERLRGELEAFELRHLAVARFAALAADPPRTTKGTIARGELLERWGELVRRLTGRYSKQPGLSLIDRERFERSTSIRLTTPRLGELMRLLALDKRYLAGQGDRLHYRDEEGEHEVLDLVGGFGGNLLGHRHPEVLAAAEGFFGGRGVFLFDQGSARPEQGELAHALSLMVGRSTGGSYIARFGSTGAEAVEMALAHALLEREERVRWLIRDQKRRFGSRRPDEVREIAARAAAIIRERAPKVLALEGAFHGHSLAARSVLFSPKKRGPFEPLTRVEPIFISAEDGPRLNALAAAEALELPVLEQQGERVVRRSVHLPGIVAAIAEPIQGEGGVQVIPPALLRRMGSFDFPLILDEIQAGLGRSGRLLASEGVRADYYLFAKALGGGVAKISALLIDRSRYVPRFDELYSSTFAGDAYSSVVAVRVLELLQQDDVPGRCRERGALLRRRLEGVREAFPGVVRAVRGQGLLLGLELDPGCAQGSMLLRAAADQELFGLLAAAYLLNRHGLRLLPTLSSPNTLRIEPSAYIDDAAIDALCRGLSALCAALRDLDTAALVSFLVRQERALFADVDVAVEPAVDAAVEPAVDAAVEPAVEAAVETAVAVEAVVEANVEAERPLPPFSTRVEAPAPDARRVAFVTHFVHPERELAMSEPTLSRLSSPARRALFDRLVALMELKPMLCFAQNLFDDRVWFLTVLMPVDAGALERLHRMDYRYLETERLQQAVDLAASRGCSAVALGGYTSILSLDGTAVMAPKGVHLTSGNTLTAVAGALRITRACRRAGIDPGDPRTRVGIVGATGNIGSSLARRLVSGPEAFSRLLLLGRSQARLSAFEQALADRHAGLETATTTEIAALGSCNVIAIATNTNAPLIYPEHLPTGRRVVIADVSVPGAVSRRVRGSPQVTVIPLAGTVAVPGEPDFSLSSHTAPGTAFCCAAEVMLLGLEPERTRGLRLTGAIDPASMAVMSELGQRHGFFADLGQGGFKAGA